MVVHSLDPRLLRALLPEEPALGPDPLSALHLPVANAPTPSAPELPNSNPNIALHWSPSPQISLRISTYERALAENTASARRELHALFRSTDANDPNLVWGFLDYARRSAAAGRTEVAREIFLALYDRIDHQGPAARGFSLMLGQAAAELIGGEFGGRWALFHNRAERDLTDPAYSAATKQLHAVEQARALLWLKEQGLDLTPSSSLLGVLKEGGPALRAFASYLHPEGDAPTHSRNPLAAIQNLSPANEAEAWVISFSRDLAPSHFSSSPANAVSRLRARVEEFNRTYASHAGLSPTELIRARAELEEIHGLRNEVFLHNNPTDLTEKVLRAQALLSYAQTEQLFYATHHSALGLDENQYREKADQLNGEVTYAQSELRRVQAELRTDFSRGDVSTSTRLLRLDQIVGSDPATEAGLLISDLEISLHFLKTATGLSAEERFTRFTDLVRRLHTLKMNPSNRQGDAAFLDRIQGLLHEAETEIGHLVSDLSTHDSRAYLENLAWFINLRPFTPEANSARAAEVLASLSLEAFQEQAEADENSVNNLIGLVHHDVIEFIEGSTLAGIVFQTGAETQTTHASDYFTIENAASGRRLQASPAFQALSSAQKRDLLRRVLQAGYENTIARSTGPVRQYYQGKLAFSQGNVRLGHARLVGFLEDTRVGAIHELPLQEKRREALGMVQPFVREAAERLSRVVTSIKAYRESRMLSHRDRIAHAAARTERFVSRLLWAVENNRETGVYDLESALRLVRAEAEAEENHFKTESIPRGVTWEAGRDVWHLRGHQPGDISFLAQADETIRALSRNPQTEIPNLHTLRLSGGSIVLNGIGMQPGVLRIRVGREGGNIVVPTIHEYIGGGQVYHFEASDHEHEIVVVNTGLSVNVHEVTSSSSGHTTNVASIPIDRAHTQGIQTQGNTLYSIVGQMSDAPLAATVNFDSRPSLLNRAENGDAPAQLELGRALRAAGDYTGATEQFVAAMGEALSNKMRYASEADLAGVRAELAESGTRNEIQANLRAQLRTLASQGVHPNAEQRQQLEAAILEDTRNEALRRHALRHLEEEIGNGHVDATVREAYEQYNSMLDPNEEWSTVSDTSRDALQDEAVALTMTMPFAGSVEAVAGSATRLVLGRILVRAGATFVEGLVEQGGGRFAARLLTAAAREGSLAARVVRLTGREVWQMNRSRLVSEAILRTGVRVGRSAGFSHASNLTRSHQSDEGLTEVQELGTNFLVTLTMEAVGHGWGHAIHGTRVARSIVAKQLGHAVTGGFGMALGDTIAGHVFDTEQGHQSFVSHWMGNIFRVGLGHPAGVFVQGSAGAILHGAAHHIDVAHYRGILAPHAPRLLARAGIPEGTPQADQLLNIMAARAVGDHGTHKLESLLQDPRTKAALDQILDRVGRSSQTLSPQEAANLRLRLLAQALQMGRNTPHVLQLLERWGKRAERDLNAIRRTLERNGFAASERTATGHSPEAELWLRNLHLSGRSQRRMLEQVENFLKPLQAFHEAFNQQRAQEGYQPVPNEITNLNRAELLSWALAQGMAPAHLEALTGYIQQGLARVVRDANGHLNLAPVEARIQEVQAAQAEAATVREAEDTAPENVQAREANEDEAAEPVTTPRVAVQSNTVAAANNAATPAPAPVPSAPTIAATPATNIGTLAFQALTQTVASLKNLFSDLTESAQANRERMAYGAMAAVALQAAGSLHAPEALPQASRVSAVATIAAESFTALASHFLHSLASHGPALAFAGATLGFLFLRSRQQKTQRAEAIQTRSAEQAATPTSKTETETGSQGNSNQPNFFEQALNNLIQGVRRVTQSSQDTADTLRLGSMLSAGLVTTGFTGSGNFWAIVGSAVAVLGSAAFARRIVTRNQHRREHLAHFGEIQPYLVSREIQSGKFGEKLQKLTELAKEDFERHPTKVRDFHTTLLEIFSLADFGESTRPLAERYRELHRQRGILNAQQRAGLQALENFLLAQSIVVHIRTRLKEMGNEQTPERISLEARDAECSKIANAERAKYQTWIQRRPAETLTTENTDTIIASQVAVLRASPWPDGITPVHELHLRVDAATPFADHVSNIEAALRTHRNQPHGLRRVVITNGTETRVIDPLADAERARARFMDPSLTEEERAEALSNYQTAVVGSVHPIHGVDPETIPALPVPTAALEAGFIEIMSLVPEGTDLFTANWLIKSAAATIHAMATSTRVSDALIARAAHLARTQFLGMAGMNYAAYYPSLARNFTPNSPELHEEIAAIREILSGDLTEHPHVYQRSIYAFALLLTRTGVPVTAAFAAAIPRHLDFLRGLPLDAEHFNARELPALRTQVDAAIEHLENLNKPRTSIAPNTTAARSLYREVPAAEPVSPAASAQRTVELSFKEIFVTAGVVALGVPVVTALLAAAGAVYLAQRPFAVAAERYRTARSKREFLKSLPLLVAHPTAASTRYGNQLGSLHRALEIVAARPGGGSRFLRETFRNLPNDGVQNLRSDLRTWWVHQFLRLQGNYEAARAFHRVYEEARVSADPAVREANRARELLIVGTVIQERLGALITELSRSRNAEERELVERLESLHTENARQLETYRAETEVSDLSRRENEAPAVTERTAPATLWEVLSLALSGVPLMRENLALRVFGGLYISILGTATLAGAGPAAWSLTAGALAAVTAFQVWGRGRLRELATVNPFHSEDKYLPRAVEVRPAPEGMVRSEPVNLHEAHDMFTQDVNVEVRDAALEADGRPRDFNQSLKTYPEAGLSASKAEVYRLVEPLHLSSFMGLVGRIPVFNHPFARFMLGIARVVFKPLPGATVEEWAAWAFYKIRPEVLRGRFQPTNGEGYTDVNSIFTRELQDQELHIHEGAVPWEATTAWIVRTTDLSLGFNNKGDHPSIREMMGTVTEKEMGELGRFGLKPGDDVSKLYEGESVTGVGTYLCPTDNHNAGSPFPSARLIYARRIPGQAHTVGSEMYMEGSVPDFEGKSGDHFHTYNARDVLVFETADGRLVTVTFTAATNVFSTEILAKVGQELNWGEIMQVYNMGSFNTVFVRSRDYHIAHSLRPGTPLDRFGSVPFLIPRPRPAGSARSPVKHATSDGVTAQNTGEVVTRSGEAATEITGAAHTESTLGPLLRAYQAVPNGENSVREFAAAFARDPEAPISGAAREFALRICNVHETTHDDLRTLLERYAALETSTHTNAAAERQALERIFLSFALAETLVEEAAATEHVTPEVMDLHGAVQSQVRRVAVQADPTETLPALAPVHPEESAQRTLQGWQIAALAVVSPILMGFRSAEGLGWRDLIWVGIFGAALKLTRHAWGTHRDLPHAHLTPGTPANLQTHEEITDGSSLAHEIHPTETITPENVTEIVSREVAELVAMPLAHGAEPLHELHLTVDSALSLAEHVRNVEAALRPLRDAGHGLRRVVLTREGEHANETHVIDSLGEAQRRRERFSDPTRDEIERVDEVLTYVTEAIGDYDFHGHTTPQTASPLPLPRAEIERAVEPLFAILDPAARSAPALINGARMALALLARVLPQTTVARIAQMLRARFDKAHILGRPKGGEPRLDGYESLGAHAANHYIYTVEQFAENTPEVHAELRGLATQLDHPNERTRYEITEGFCVLLTKLAHPLPADLAAALPAYRDFLRGLSLQSPYAGMDSHARFAEKVARTLTHLDSLIARPEEVAQDNGHLEVRPVTPEASAQRAAGGFRTGLMIVFGLTLTGFNTPMGEVSPVTIAVGTLGILAAIGAASSFLAKQSNNDRLYLTRVRAKLEAGTRSANSAYGREIGSAFALMEVLSLLPTPHAQTFAPSFESLQSEAGDISPELREALPARFLELAPNRERAQNFVARYLDVRAAAEAGQPYRESDARALAHEMERAMLTFYVWQFAFTFFGPLRAEIEIIVPLNELIQNTAEQNREAFRALTAVAENPLERVVVEETSPPTEPVDAATSATRRVEGWKVAAVSVFGIASYGFDLNTWWNSLAPNDQERIVITGCVEGLIIGATVAWRLITAIRDENALRSAYGPRIEYFRAILDQLPKINLNNSDNGAQSQYGRDLGPVMHLLRFFAHHHKSEYREAITPTLEALDRDPNGRITEEFREAVIEGFLKASTPEHLPSYEMFVAEYRALRRNLDGRADIYEQAMIARLFIHLFERMAGDLRDKLHDHIEGLPWTDTKDDLKKILKANIPAKLLPLLRAADAHRQTLFDATGFATRNIPGAAAPLPAAGERISPVEEIEPVDEPTGVIDTSKIPPGTGGALGLLLMFKFASMLDHSHAFNEAAIGPFSPGALMVGGLVGGVWHFRSRIRELVGVAVSAALDTARAIPTLLLEQIGNEHLAYALGVLATATHRPAEDRIRVLSAVLRVLPNERFEQVTGLVSEAFGTASGNSELGLRALDAIHAEVSGRRALAHDAGLGNIDATLEQHRRAHRERMQPTRRSSGTPEVMSRADRIREGLTEATDPEALFNALRESPEESTTHTLTAAFRVLAEARSEEIPALLEFAVYVIQQTPLAQRATALLRLLQHCTERSQETRERAEALAREHLPPFTIETPEGHDPILRFADAERVILGRADLDPAHPPHTRSYEAQRGGVQVYFARHSSNGAGQVHGAIIRGGLAEEVFRAPIADPMVNSRWSMRLGSRLSTGAAYPIEVQNTAETVTVRIPNGGARAALPLSSLTWSRLSAEAQAAIPEHRPDLVSLTEASPTEDFPGFPHCVVMGEANPHGLHLRVEYPQTGPLSHVWVRLNETTGTDERAIAAAVDVSAGVAGLIRSGLPGPTARWTDESRRAPVDGEALVVSAEIPPASNHTLQNVTVWVVSGQTGEVLRRSTLTLAPQAIHAATAQASGGQALLERAAELHARLNQEGSPTDPTTTGFNARGGSSGNGGGDQSQHEQSNGISDAPAALPTTITIGSGSTALKATVTDWTRDGDLSIGMAHVHEDSLINSARRHLEKIALANPSLPEGRNDFESLNVQAQASPKSYAAAASQMSDEALGNVFGALARIPYWWNEHRVALIGGVLRHLPDADLRRIIPILEHRFIPHNDPLLTLVALRVVYQIAGARENNETLEAARREAGEAIDRHSSSHRVSSEPHSTRLTLYPELADQIDSLRPLLELPLTESTTALRIGEDPAQDELNLTGLFYLIPETEGAHTERALDLALRIIATLPEIEQRRALSRFYERAAAHSPETLGLADVMRIAILPPYEMTADETGHAGTAEFGPGAEIFGGSPFTHCGIMGYVLQTRYRTIAERANNPFSQEPVAQVHVRQGNPLSVNHGRAWRVITPAESGQLRNYIAVGEPGTDLSNPRNVNSAYTERPNKPEVIPPLAVPESCHAEHVDQLPVLNDLLTNAPGQTGSFYRSLRLRQPVRYVRDAEGNISHLVLRLLPTSSAEVRRLHLWRAVTTGADVATFLFLKSFGATTHNRMDLPEDLHPNEPIDIVVYTDPQSDGGRSPARVALNHFSIQCGGVEIGRAKVNAGRPISTALTEQQVAANRSMEDLVNYANSPEARAAETSLPAPTRRRGSTVAAFMAAGIATLFGLSAFGQQVPTTQTAHGLANHPVTEHVQRVAEAAHWGILDYLGAGAGVAAAGLLGLIAFTWARRWFREFRAQNHTPLVGRIVNAAEGCSEAVQAAWRHVQEADYPMEGLWTELEMSKARIQGQQERARLTHELGQISRQNGEALREAHPLEQRFDAGLKEFRDRIEAWPIEAALKQRLQNILSRRAAIASLALLKLRLGRVLTPVERLTLEEFTWGFVDREQGRADRFLFTLGSMDLLAQQVAAGNTTGTALLREGFVAEANLLIETEEARDVIRHGFEVARGGGVADIQEAGVFGGISDPDTSAWNRGWNLISAAVGTVLPRLVMGFGRSLFAFVWHSTAFYLGDAHGLAYRCNQFMEDVTWRPLYDEATVLAHEEVQLESIRRHHNPNRVRDMDQNLRAEVARRRRELNLNQHDQELRAITGEKAREFSDDPEETGVIEVADHYGFVSQIVVTAAMGPRTRAIASKPSNWSNLLAGVVRRTHSFPVHRVKDRLGKGQRPQTEYNAAARAAFKDLLVGCIRRISDQVTVLIFGEGTRSETIMGPLKSGSAEAAFLTGANLLVTVSEGGDVIDEGQHNLPMPYRARMIRTRDYHSIEGLHAAIEQTRVALKRECVQQVAQMALAGDRQAIRMHESWLRKSRQGLNHLQHGNVEAARAWAKQTHTDYDLLIALHELGQTGVLASLDSGNHTVSEAAIQMYQRVRRAAERLGASHPLAQRVLHWQETAHYPMDRLWHTVEVEEARVRETENARLIAEALETATERDSSLVDNATLTAGIEGLHASIDRVLGSPELRTRLHHILARRAAIAQTAHLKRALGIELHPVEAVVLEDLEACFAPTREGHHRAAPSEAPHRDPFVVELRRIAEAGNLTDTSVLENLAALEERRDITYNSYLETRANTETLSGAERAAGGMLEGALNTLDPLFNPVRFLWTTGYFFYQVGVLLFKDYREATWPNATKCFYRARRATGISINPRFMFDAQTIRDAAEAFAHGTVEYTTHPESTDMFVKICFGAGDPFGMKAVVSKIGNNGFTSILRYMLGGVKPIFISRAQDRVGKNADRATRAAAALEALRQLRGGEEGLYGIKDAMAEGRSVIVFGEGTRSLTGSMGDPKDGSIRIVWEMRGTSLVSISLGTGAVLRGHRQMPLFYRARLLRATDYASFEDFFEAVRKTRVELWMQAFRENHELVEGGDFQAARTERHLTRALSPGIALLREGKTEAARAWAKKMKTDFRLLEAMHAHLGETSRTTAEPATTHQVRAADLAEVREGDPASPLTEGPTPLAAPLVQTVASPAGTEHAAAPHNPPGLHTAHTASIEGVDGEVRAEEVAPVSETAATETPTTANRTAATPPVPWRFAAPTAVSGLAFLSAATSMGTALFAEFLKLPSVFLLGAALFDALDGKTARHPRIGATEAHAKAYEEANANNPLTRLHRFLIAVAKRGAETDSDVDRFAYGVGPAVIAMASSAHNTETTLGAAGVFLLGVMATTNIGYQALRRLGRFDRIKQGKETAPEFDIFGNPYNTNTARRIVDWFIGWTSTSMAPTLAAIPWFTQQAPAGTTPVVMGVLATLMNLNARTPKPFDGSGRSDAPQMIPWAGAGMFLGAVWSAANNLSPAWGAWFGGMVGGVARYGTAPVMDALRRKTDTWKYRPTADTAVWGAVALGSIAGEMALADSVPNLLVRTAAAAATCIGLGELLTTRYMGVGPLGRFVYRPPRATDGEVVDQRAFGQYTTALVSDGRRNNLPVLTPLLSAEERANLTPSGVTVIGIQGYGANQGQFGELPRDMAREGDNVQLLSLAGNADPTWTADQAFTSGGGFTGNNLFRYWLAHETAINRLIDNAPGPVDMMVASVGAELWEYIYHRLSPERRAKIRYEIMIAPADRVDPIEKHKIAIPILAHLGIQYRAEANPLPKDVRGSIDRENNPYRSLASTQAVGLLSRAGHTAARQNRHDGRQICIIHDPEDRYVSEQTIDDLEQVYTSGGARVVRLTPNSAGSYPHQALLGPNRQDVYGGIQGFRGVTSTAPNAMVGE